MPTSSNHTEVSAHCCHGKHIRPRIPVSSAAEFICVALILGKLQRMGRKECFEKPYAYFKTTAKTVFFIFPKIKNQNYFISNYYSCFCKEVVKMPRYMYAMHVSRNILNIKM
jgi:hypothetical protein